MADDITIRARRYDGGIKLELLINGRELCAGADTTPNKAALWLARHVNRLAGQTEELLVDLGYCTEDEIDAIVSASREEIKGVVPAPEGNVTK